ncbi:tryptophan synthase subunit alpha [Streptomyces purpurascens]|uniref:tryptophan synthase subunit alpha n=1 Tax=Streptomyces purpurascens TaxID=1924 RepID=UPI003F4D11E6
MGLATEHASLDGPVIRAAYERALRRGHVLDRTLRAVEHASRLRPAVVMTYWEPVRLHGPEDLARLFADAGAAGVMVVDLPGHQAERWQAAAKDVNLHTPRLVPRHIADIDLAAVAAGASGWLYAPASTTPTGYRGPLDIPALADFTQRLRSASALPVVSGVGVSTPALAARVAPLVDAIAIGTPVVRALATAPRAGPGTDHRVRPGPEPAHRHGDPYLTPPLRPRTSPRSRPTRPPCGRPCASTPPTVHPHWPPGSPTPSTSPTPPCDCSSPSARRRRSPHPRTCCSFTSSRRSPRPPQDTGAELAAALARGVENQRRQADAVSKRVVLVGPTPRQFIESAVDLLDRILALCHAISRERPIPPSR